MNKYILFPVLALGALASCVDDKGNYEYTPLNEATIEDIESSYSAISGITEIEIDPTIKGDIYEKDLSNYEFKWHVCGAGIGNDSHDHHVISNEKVLKWLVDEPVGSYTLYLTVKDKTSGIEKLTSTSLQVSSPFGRGFMLVGTDGKDDLAMIDMLAMPATGDTAYVENALTNDGSLHNPKSIFYTGSSYANYQDYMWLFCEKGSAKLNSFTADGPEFDILGTFASLGIADNEYGHVNENIIGQFPVRAPGGTNMARTVICMTDNCVYGPKSAYGEVYYAEPCNRMAASTTSPLFKFYPMVFYNGASTYIAANSTPFYLYDTEHDKFVKINADFLGASNCTDLIDYSTDNWRFDCKSLGRTLVYGQNTSTPGMGYSYFVMKDVTKNDVFEIYSLYMPRTKESFPIDLSKAKDFDKASLYSFIGCRRAVFYAVGSVLHQYDFERNLYTSMDLGEEITMIKPEIYSARRHNDLMVATWDASAGQGHFMKLEIGENPNTVEMAIRNDFLDEDGIEDPSKYLEKWPTRLKIVDAEWRVH